ncbi:MAG: hypothetical protein WAX69_17130 [Victivallales bacterium]
MILDRGKFTRFKDFIFRPEDLDGVVGEKDQAGDDFLTVVYFKGHGHSFKDNDREYLDYFDSILINRQLMDNQVELSARSSEKKTRSQ